jgi:hypothetical protein
MKPIAVFYHSVYSPNALPIIREAVDALEQTELAKAAEHLELCFNGHPYGEVKLPENAIVTVHPEGSCNENLTIVAAHEFAKAHPEWNILYFHSKGATHGPDHWSIPLMTRWRACMMEHCVHKWKECIEVLQCYEAVGAHWMEKQAHNIPFSMFGGNFWWARSEFLATVPSMYERHKERTGNLWDWDNRYEAEVWIGTGPRDPIVFSYHPGHPGCHG